MLTISVLGGSVKYRREFGLDGLRVVQLAKFRLPAPLVVVSTSAFKDGRILALTVQSTFDLLGLQLSHCDRFESDKVHARTQSSVCL